MIHGRPLLREVDRFDAAGGSLQPVHFSAFRTRGRARPLFPWVSSEVAPLGSRYPSA
jgi:hypothetical protein